MIKENNPGWSSSTMDSVLNMCPFSSIPKERMARKVKTALLHSVIFPILLASTLFWHVRTEVILYGTNRPVGELLLWQIQADAA